MDMSLANNPCNLVESFPFSVLWFVCPDFFKCTAGADDSSSFGGKLESQLTDCIFTFLQHTSYTV